MSALKEYLKLVPIGIKNPGKVMEGWVNAARESIGAMPEHEIKEIIRRRAICHECPFMSSNAKELVGYKTERKDEHCTLCSCPIVSKTASFSSACGAQSYNESHPNSPKLEVKFHEYSYTP